MIETLVLNQGFKLLFSKEEFSSLKKKPHLSPKSPLFTKSSLSRNVNQDFKWTN